MLFFRKKITEYKHFYVYLQQNKTKKTVMLIKFAVKNFRGFSERIEWDLSHPSNYSFNTYAIKDGVVKNGIIYGPNGSGKSNFALAIFDIVYHLKYGELLQIPIRFKNYFLINNLQSKEELIDVQNEDEITYNSSLNDNLLK